MTLRRGACYVLATVVTFAGLALALRVLAGPLDRPIPIRSPLNVESMFAAGGLLLLLFRANRTRGAERERALSRWDPAAAAAIALAAIAAFAWTARFYF